MPQTPGRQGAACTSATCCRAKSATPRFSTKDAAYRYLVEVVNWGKPLRLTVRRGLPNPYTSHPRLDLFVGSLSPHKMHEIGCTICHEGQGSATDFKWASHTPNDRRQADEWKRKHGWFNNHHWIFPMNPKRFAESSCLKCHHDVVELEPSERFPDPPAPKLMDGYDTDSPVRLLRLPRNQRLRRAESPHRSRHAGRAELLGRRTGAAGQRLSLNAQQKALGRSSRVPARRRPSAPRLLESIRLAAAAQADVKSAETRPRRQPTKPAANSTAPMRKLANVLDDVESPGKLRKVGPSLRHVASKVDYDFLYSWIRKPKDFRPDDQDAAVLRPDRPLGRKAARQDDSERFEPIEIRGIAEYLLAKSQPFEFDKLPKRDESPRPSAARSCSKTRGCLACHKHADFPQGADEARPGPVEHRRQARPQEQSQRRPSGSTAGSAIRAITIRGR